MARAAALAAMVLLLVVSPAQAISMYFTGPGGWGVSQADALGSGLLIIDQAPSGLNGELDVATPDPILANTDPIYTPPDDPATGTTTWEVTNLSLFDDQDLWLVFFSGGMNDTNYPGLTPDQVGLEMSSPNWALFHTTAGVDDYYYPGIYLGDLPIGDPAAPALIEYRVLQNLATVGSNYMFPRMSIGRANAVPEPSVLCLVAAGLVSLATARRLRC